MIRKIHWIKRQAGMSEEEYRTMLASYGVESSKELSYWEGVDLIKKMEGLVKNKIRHKDNLNRYEELGIRWDEVRGEYMATPKQLRMIEAMWCTHPLVDQKNEEALRKFVKRITGVDRLEWLYMSDIKKVVNAIKSLKKGENLES